MCIYVICADFLYILKKFWPKRSKQGWICFGIQLRNIFVRLSSSGFYNIQAVAGHPLAQCVPRIKQPCVLRIRAARLSAAVSRIDTHQLHIRPAPVG